MPPSIVLDVSHPTLAPGKIEGFRFMWAFYVNGYDPESHCQQCFKGSRVDEFSTGTAVSGRPFELNRMDRYPFVYVCGVGVGPKAELHSQNLHFPLKYSEGAVAEASTYNGYTFRAQNAVILPIPDLPLGWHGKPEEHSRCKNFQFVVEYFGYPPRADGGARVIAPA